MNNMAQSSDARTEAVLRATSRWQKDLVDTSGRNRLRRYRDLKTGTLDLTPGRAEGLDEGALDRLLSGKAVGLSDLFPDRPDGPDQSTAFNDARRRLTAIHKAAVTNLEEKGIETLLVAIGLASWPVQSGTPLNSRSPSSRCGLSPPVPLPGTSGSRLQAMPISTRYSPTSCVPSMTSRQTAKRGIWLETLPPAWDGYLALLRRFKESWRVVPDLGVELRIVAATFSYSTMPLVTDLEQNGELFAANDIVAAIAGDKEARATLASRICDPGPSQPDVDPPSEEFLVLDADSSQHLAINRVLGGESLVIQGPPGTGKSQTIANLITALIARGKRVLFVAEKRAAIEAVTKRLEQVGLGDLVMDMHGGVTSRRDFARTLDDSLRRVAAIPAQDHSALHRRLQEHRAPLIANDAALHDQREPWKLCVFELRERVLAIPEEARTQMRLSTEAAYSLDNEGFERLSGEIEEWIELGGHLLPYSHPEWSRTHITTPDGARRAFELVSRLVSDQLPAARHALFSALDEAGLPRPETVVQWRRANTFLTVASASRWARMKAQVLSGEYRLAKKELGSPGSLTLTPSTAKLAGERVSVLVASLDSLSAVAGLDLLEMLHTDLAASLERWRPVALRPRTSPAFASLKHAFARPGHGTSSSVSAMA